MRELDNCFKADEGKIWQFTDKCETWASYKGRTGKFYNDNYVSRRMVEDGIVIEVDDPDWIEMPGFRAVYDVMGDGKYIFDTCNHIVYHCREMAEVAAKAFNNRPWGVNKDSKAFVIDAIYKGKRPKACRKYEGKTVYNSDYWMYDREVGSLVEEEIVDYAANCVPPLTFTTGLVQCGEPAESKVEGTTYATFKRITKDIWMYCGNCFKGEDTERGTLIPYVS